MSINIFLSRDEVHAILRNPYRANGRQPSVAATRWRSPTSASASRCTSTPRRASSRGSLRDGYEVHIRMPYRTAQPPQAADRGEPRVARQPQVRRPGGHASRAPRARPAATLQHPEASHA